MPAAKPRASFPLLHKPQTAPRRGGRLIVDALIAHGIEHVFAVPGESYLDVLDALYEVQDKLRLVTCRIESGAVYMAEAYGKLTKRPACAIVTRGPGACQGAIGVHVARQDGTPLLLLVGQVPKPDRDRESFQEVNYRAMFGPLAKWVTEIDRADRVPELIAHAVDVATEGRPGPVVVSIPEDMQAETATVPDLGPLRRFRPAPDPAAMAELVRLLARAHRPLAILGGGPTEEGQRNLSLFLEAWNLPVTVAFRRQGLFPGTSPLYAGDLGIGSDPALLAALREADLVLAVGTRLGEAVTQGYTLFDQAVPLVHVYPDGAEIGRVFRPALGIAADLDLFAAAAAAMPPLAPPAWGEWTKALRALREADREPPLYPGPLNLARVMRELEALLPDDAILTTDAGNFAVWATRFMHLKPGQAYVGPAAGAMGYAVPAAVGAAIAFPKRLAVALVGDGGFLMTGMELATAFHHGARPIVLVFNNNMYGTIRMHQEARFPGRGVGTALTNPDFARLMAAFGGYAEAVAQTGEFAPAFRRAWDSGLPALIELRLDPAQISTRHRLGEPDL